MTHMINNNPEYLLMVAREKNISKAAKKLYISQPYLSQYLLKLEKEMDVKLFDRSKTPLELTEAGKIYSNYLESRKLLDQKLKCELAGLHLQRVNTLNLGFGNWRASTVLPDLLPHFIKLYPKVHIVLHEHPINELYQLIEQDAIDFAIMNLGSTSPNNITREIINYERFLLAANRKNPLTKKLMAQKKQFNNVDLEIVENELFILLKPGLVCSNLIANYLDKKKFCPNNFIVTTDNTTAENMVAANLGFCFLPEECARQSLKNKDLVFFDLQSEDLIAPLGVVYKKNSFLSPISREFIDIAINYYSTKVDI